MSHLKYAFFFALIAVLLAYWGIVRAGHVFVTGAMIWGGVSFATLSLAYGGKRPFWVMGRRFDARRTLFSNLLLLINFPFLLLCWSTWFLYVAISREEAVNRIGETNLSVSRWPLFAVPLDSYDVIIDMTAEMPKLYRTKNRYVLFPNLDGIPLSDWSLPDEIDQNTKTLVHCAQGHGRSAIMAAFLLLKLRYVPSAEEAVALLKTSRPGIHLNPAQRRQVDSFEIL